MIRYAPSVPLLSDFKNKKNNIKDLLLRAKAGTQSGDIVSEAHVTFYLGMIYETKKCHQSAIKYYKKFCSCAKILKDKIGLSIGTNRIAINYFYKEDYDNAIEFNKQNIQISDSESQFPGYYNLGICFRKLKQYENALINLRKALDWTLQFNVTALSHSSHRNNHSLCNASTPSQIAKNQGHPTDPP